MPPLRGLFGSGVVRLGYHSFAPTGLVRGCGFCVWVTIVSPLRGLYGSGVVCLGYHSFAPTGLVRGCGGVGFVFGLP
jgi:hypothetical protein